MIKKLIKIGVQEISYELKVSRQARSLRLEVKASGLVATKPRLAPDILVERFIKEKAEWILKSLAKIKEAHLGPEISPDDLKVLKKRAAKLLIARLEFFNKHYHYKYLRLSVRSQKTRWGSCSRSGTLSFNCRLALLPLPLLDYVVVHELCHLGQMNHSPRFWSLVAETIPDYQERRYQLKKHCLL